MYNSSALSSSSYGDHWRNLRRIGSTHIFSTHRLNSFLNVRRDEVKRLLRRLCFNSGEHFVSVELKSMVSDLTLNIIMRMVAGKRYFGDINVEDEEEASQFKELIAHLFFYGGATNKQDLSPVLKWISGGSYEKQIKELGSRADKLVQKLIDEQREQKQGDFLSNTMIGHILSLQESQPEYYTDEIIKGTILVMLLGGTDTSAVTIEWAHHLGNSLVHARKA